MVDVSGYEGLYTVDREGNFWSWPRKGVPGHSLRAKKQYVNPKGYLQVQLSKAGKQATLKSHRLVATAFVENLEKKPHINHKNGIKTDNRAENLEWCTISENLKHAFKLGLKSCKGEKNPRWKGGNSWNYRTKYWARERGESDVY